MAKIGRNERCPCGSGKKYKRCCGLKQAMAPRPAPASSPRVTLMENVKNIQQAAVEKRHHIIEIGVFVLFSTEVGDSWLLELTDSDCIQLADQGKVIEASIKEDPKVIEVDWTHTFDFSEKQFAVTTYADKTKQVMSDYPTMELAASIRRIRKKFSQAQLDKVHLDPDSIEKSA